MADLKDIYTPCPEHPQADIRRDHLPGHDGKGRPMTKLVAVCGVCGKVLQKMDVKRLK